MVQAEAAWSGTMPLHISKIPFIRVDRCSHFLLYKWSSV